MAAGCVCVYMRGLERFLRPQFPFHPLPLVSSVLGGECLCVCVFFVGWGGGLTCAGWLNYPCVRVCDGVCAYVCVMLCVCFPLVCVMLCVMVRDGGPIEERLKPWERHDCLRGDADGIQFGVSDLVIKARAGDTATSGDPLGMW